MGLKDRAKQNEIVSKRRMIIWLLEIAPFVSMGLIKSTSPNIRLMLAMFEPTMFPRIRPSACPRIAAIEVNNSGAEVATDIMVSPITRLGTPNVSAMCELWSLSQSPPFVSRNRPKIIARIRIARYANPDVLLICSVRLVRI